MRNPSVKRSKSRFACVKGLSHTSGSLPSATHVGILPSGIGSDPFRLPGQEVFVNQNPGSWWRANGRPAFPGRRGAEPMVPFVVRADASGRLELRSHPRGLELGLALHSVGAVTWIAAGLRQRPVRVG